MTPRIGRIIGAACGAFWIDAARAVPPADSSATAPAAIAAFDHGEWSRLLAAYVDSAGRVAYLDLGKRDRVALRSYLDRLGAATPDRWPPEAQIAFWLNAYNAGMVWAVLQGQSAETLIARARLFKSWKFRVAGKDRSPDEVEHEILRKQFVEPRVHFALVCASTSCPPLRRSAYTADSLAVQLDDQARRFVGDPTRNRIDAAAGLLELSSIFDWFRADFERAAGSVPRYLARYVRDPAARDWLLIGAVPPRYRDYDWTLNHQPSQRPDRRNRSKS